MEPAFGCWKQCVSTRRRSSTSPAKATTYGAATATTTPRWRRYSTHPQTGATSGASNRPTAEIDNLRAAFAWSRENSDTELALTLASSLQPLWLTRGRIQEGLKWLGAALADESPESADTSAARVRASVDKALLLSFVGMTDDVDDGERTLAAARELGDPALVVRALTACGGLAIA